MAFTAKRLSWSFPHLNVVGCLLKRRPSKGGGGHGHPITPPSYAPGKLWTKILTTLAKRRRSYKVRITVYI